MKKTRAIMGKAKSYKLLAVGAVVFATSLMFLISNPSTVSAGVARGGKNNVERSRAALCDDPSQTNTIFGAVWINDVSTSDGTDARWNESASISFSATFVDLTMWSTAYNCPDGATRTGAKIVGLTPASGGQAPISFPYGTEIYRGDSSPGQFTDPPGSLRVRLDLSGKGSGCHTVAYSGTYSDSRGTGSATTYFTNICINRAVQIQGTVMKIDLSGNRIGVSGVRIPICYGGIELTTDANGWFQYELPNNVGFCARTQTGYSPGSDYDGPFLRPWSEGYNTCQGYTDPSPAAHCPKPPFATINDGIQSGYEWQLTGGNSGNGYDRNWDGGYDIIFVQKSNGSILGRVFIDTNSNGTWDSGEKFVQNGVNCGSSFVTLGATVNISGVGNSPPNKCNPEPYYQTSVNPGTYTVSVNPPSGYSATTGPQTCSVPLGSECHKWFGIKIADRPPSISVTPSCSSRNFTVNASDPDGNNFNVRYRINGGSWVDRAYSGSPFTINMSSYDQYVRHTIEANTNGSPPPGGTATANISATAVYGGAGANQACIDRDFTTQPTAASPLLNDEEAPTKADFSGGANATFSPSIGPNRVNNVQLTRRYIIKRIAGGETVMASSPGTTSENLTPSVNLTQNNVNLPAVQVGDQVCIRVSVRPTAGKIDTVGGITTSNNVTSAEKEECASIAAKPYFRVYGGDVRAGGAFSSGAICGASSTGSIKAWLKPDNKSGSGVQFAAMAIGQINGFASASLRTSNPQPRDGLTFANRGSGTPGNFITTNCTPDYFASTQFSNSDITKQENIASGSVRNAANICTQKNKQSLFVMLNPTNKLFLTAPGELGNCRHTIYVDGDVHIQNNLVYSNGDPTWANASDTPYFTLIAKGNIYISEQVTRLDGLYIAQPRASDPNRGRIYTCRDNASGNSISDSELYSRCKQQLVVRGAFVSQTIRLLRTFGSLRNSNAGELAGGTRSTNCDNSVVKPSTCAAEVFESSPELFVGSPVFSPVGGLRAGSFTSYTILPPIL